MIFRSRSQLSAVRMPATETQGDTEQKALSLPALCASVANLQPARGGCREQEATPAGRARLMATATLSAKTTTSSHFSAKYPRNIQGHTINTPLFHWLERITGRRTRHWPPAVTASQRCRRHPPRAQCVNAQGQQVPRCGTRLSPRDGAREQRPARGGSAI